MGIASLLLRGLDELTIPASLKDDTARMNDRKKHKVTGQMKHQTADPKTNASLFLFLPIAHFLKTILPSRTNGTFGFARHTKPTLQQNQKSHFLPTHDIDTSI